MELDKLPNKKIFLLSLRLPSNQIKETEASLIELGSLTTTLGLTVINSQIQKRNAIHPKTFFGSGKIEELKELFNDLKPKFIFIDQNLTPAQEKNLNIAFGLEVWDRTKVILKIFEMQAKSNEAKEQVELATLEYLLPRLTGMWEHLDREKGGAAVSKGMGEKQINVDRNLIRKKITTLKKRINNKQKTLDNQIKGRDNFFKVSLVGYTNAGKSTLMNHLTDAQVSVTNRLFETLDTTTRIIKNLCKPDILLSDTVGFIHNLPHSLIASFRSTFSVIKDSDLLLHVIEANKLLELERYIETNNFILKELELDSIPRKIIITKTDKIKNIQTKIDLLTAAKGAIEVSIFDSSSLENLKNYLKNFFAKNFITQKIYVPYLNKNLTSFIFNNSIIQKVKYESKGIYFEYSLSIKNAAKLDLLKS